jgi:hypothetical protein
METQEYQLTKSDRNRLARERTRELQQCFTELLYMTLSTARKYVELVATHQPELLIKEFNDALNAHETAVCIIEILKDSGRAILDGIDNRPLTFEPRDLFYALTRETQSRLRQQGIFFDTFMDVAPSPT